MEIRPASMDERQAILFLVEQPIDRWNFLRFGIATWRRRGWNVIIWDITPWAWPQVWKNFLRRGGTLYASSRATQISSHAEFCARFRELKAVNFFVDLTGDSYHPLLVKGLLILCGIKRLAWSTSGVVPGMVTPPLPTLFERLSAAYRSGPMEVIRRLLAFAVRRIASSAFAPSIFVVLGEFSLRQADLRHSEIVKAHHPDYDKYLQLRRRDYRPPRKVAVFIDQYLCFHPDFNSLRSAPVSADRYFPSLIRFFREVSHRLGVEIRIAGHPRAASDSSYTARFKPYEVTFGQTPQEILSSSVVLCHATTAISFAVLFGRPFMLLTTNQMVATPEGEWTQRLGNYFSKRPVNIDAPLSSVDWEDTASINQSRFSDYIREYIKSPGTPELPAWEIIISHVERTMLNKKQTGRQ